MSGIIQMNHEVDPAKDLMDKLGDISGIEIFNNEVLVAVYLRPEKTKGGVILSTGARNEDKYQSKIGLVVKAGNSAFEEDGSWFRGVSVQEGDWVLFRPSDGYEMKIGEATVRLFLDTAIRGKVKHPDLVW